MNLLFLDYVGYFNSLSKSQFRFLFMIKFILVAEPVPSEEAECLSSVRTRVAQLYEVLHVDQHQLNSESRLISQIERIQEELAPLEKVRTAV